MGDIVDFRLRVARALGEEGSESFDLFLVEEGLELLAAFRSLRDVDLQASILGLVKSIAAGTDTMRR